MSAIPDQDIPKAIGDAYKRLFGPTDRCGHKSDLINILIWTYQSGRSFEELGVDPNIIRRKIIDEIKRRIMRCVRGAVKRSRNLNDDLNFTQQYELGYLIKFGPFSDNEKANIGRMFDAAKTMLPSFIAYRAGTQKRRPTITCPFHAKRRSLATAQRQL